MYLINQKIKHFCLIYFLCRPKYNCCVDGTNAPCKYKLTKVLDQT